MTKIFESTIEEFVIELLENQGWQYVSPEDQVMMNFNIFTQPIFSKLKNNNSQIQSLSTLCDTLLPKLMKGEVRVKGFNN